MRLQHTHILFICFSCLVPMLCLQKDKTLWGSSSKSMHSSHYPSVDKQISYGGRWPIYSIPGTSVSNKAEDYVSVQSNTAQQFPSGLVVFHCCLHFVGIFSLYTLFRTCCSDFRSYITVSVLIWMTTISLALFYQKSFQHCFSQKH